MREFNALKKVYLDAQRPMQIMYAQIQATLHNAHFKRPGGGRFMAEEFLGEKVPQTVEQKKAALAALFGQGRRKSGEVYWDKNDPVKRSHG